MHLFEWDFPPKANTIQQKILQNTNSHLPQTLKPFNVSMKIPTVVLLPTLQKVHAKLWFVDRFKNGVPKMIMKCSYIFIWYVTLYFLIYMLGLSLPYLVVLFFQQLSWVSLVDDRVLISSCCNWYPVYSKTYNVRMYITLNDV